MNVEELETQFQKYVETLRKTNRVSIHVTTISRSSVCPFQSFFYSRQSPIKPKSSRSFVVGTLAHLIFELIYEPRHLEALKMLKNDLLAIQDLHEFKLKLTRDAIHKLSVDEPAKYEQFEEDKDAILTDVLKYTNAFLNYAKYAPIPYARERFVQKGIVCGTIDRIDYIKQKNEIIIIDYKTSRSKLNDDLLRQYFLQLGGYAYILKDSKLLKNKRLGVPRLVVLKQRSFQIYPCFDYEHYIDDFEYLLTEYAKMLLEARYLKEINREPGSHCSYCLVREYCQKLKEE